ncbi:DUF3558 domain-containing protein [Nocardia sp. CA-119907]|uniref:DUF3558 domain-containing protein n=1 Tax=Nocardia sp. CA-119907 TaxID=3239973 RepID=UPI003D97A4C1
MAHRSKLMLLAAAVLPWLVACGGSKSGNPSASSETNAVPVKLFDPCTGIADGVLAAAGVDPATKESGIAGVHQSGWEICNWKGSKYYVTVFSTGRTVTEFEHKEGNVDFQDVTVAGRKGRQFKVAGASKDLGCDVLFPATQGVLQLRVLNKASLDNPEDPCVELYRVGDAIVPVLPQ